jgi:hypothetical protein
MENKSKTVYVFPVFLFRATFINIKMGFMAIFPRTIKLDGEGLPVRLPIVRTLFNIILRTINTESRQAVARTHQVNVASFNNQQKHKILPVFRRQIV